MTESEDIARRSTMEELVRTYMEAEKDIRTACKQIADAVTRINDVVKLGETSGGVDLRPPHNRRMDYSDPVDAITELRRQVWRCLVDRLELRRMMSVRRANELDKWLDRKEVEEISFESVLGLWKYYTENLPGMIQEAVTEVYDFLRPTHTELKTNTQFELRTKVILEGWVEHKGLSKSGYWPKSWRRPHFVALENVFSALDGQGSISKSHYSDLERAIEDTTVGETRYFRYKLFRNGNLHLKFLRADLVKRFNEMAGGLRLKPEHA